MPVELETEAQEWFETHCPFGRGFRRVAYRGDRDSPMVVGHVGAGANMALRRCVLRDVGAFDVALDAGTRTFSGGDHEMFSRILLHGYRIVYDPAALSWHRTPRTPEEIRRIIYGYGVGVYAFLTRRLVIDKETAALRVAWRWLCHGQIPALVQSILRRPGSIPAGLLLSEFRGCMIGPWAYLASRRAVLRQEADRAHP